MKQICTLFLVFFTCYIHSQKTITYNATDGVTITADFYEAKGSNQFIILFHQAGWSRGEYKEIAPKLNALGYNCLAVDQRSGGAVNGVQNETNAMAKKKGKKTEFVDAFQDLEASIAYVKETYHPKKLVIWGSSYSSSLVLKYVGEYPDGINGVLSFSPGEYFEDKKFITKSASHIKIPVFITSAQNEKKNWSAIYDAIPSTKKHFFLPKTKGNHGSRALWAKFSDHDEYWQAVKAFIEII
ncbi:alpha/beta hydrolase [Aquimarina algiphila]|uniref:alpha/beta hydrolase n=1 Tax=Aquimarina algiphila TaxID=2047982 RepID=UPI00232D439F|nr:alpha/beta fold hydrolase [Aquimarina algiphila]